ncbi:c-type cytochrome [Tropicimonas aquimaris]|uniref:C-type cytochrome n=1 Tax=Tropicimonas aquimaris TaxID=914152 RepID=A0ABW3IXM0_9RHOB
MLDSRDVGRCLLATTLCVFTVPAALAQDTTFGEYLFKKNCAVCHGAAAAGDGPVAELFQTKPKNLQLLSQENNSAFPFSEVYRSIDGRKEIAGHGTSEMPVWGDLFYAEAVPDTFHPGMDADEIVQARILALVYFLQTVQQ